MNEANLASPTAKSPVAKRSIVINGRKTSISIEIHFGMQQRKSLEEMPRSTLVGEIDTGRQQHNLSSAIRLFVLDFYVKLAKRE